MLVIDISINRRTVVSSIGAVRMSPEGDVDEDTICEYYIGRIFDGKIKRPIGIIQHRYGDGAEVLAEKVLSVSNNHIMTSSEESRLESLIQIAKDEMLNS